MNYYCLVCGYGMSLPPVNYNICASCGTEFENDDADSSHEELRNRWIENGMHWWSSITPKPVGWNPTEQLTNIGYDIKNHSTVKTKR